MTKPVLPRAIDNRPGLDRIDYRVGEYTDFREAILWSADRAPELETWTHRASDDPLVALVECGAITLDILTQYQQVYANELMLRTATWRESVARLAELVGYRMFPGVGGTGRFVIELRKDAPVEIPAGLGLQVELEGVDKPVDLEVTRTITAYPWLNTLRLYRPSEQPAIDRMTRALEVAKSELPTAWSVGDSIALVTTSDAPVRAVTTLVTVTIADVTERPGSWVFALDAPPDLAAGESLDQMHAYRVAGTYRHFGHNAPPTYSHVTAGSTVVAAATPTTRVLGSGPTTSSVPDTHGDHVEPRLEATELPLDAEAPDVARADRLFIEVDFGSAAHVHGRQLFVREVRSVRDATVRWGNLCGAVTIATLITPLRSLHGGGFSRHQHGHLRSMRIHHAESPAVPVRAARVAGSSTASHQFEVFLPDDQTEILRDRSLLVVGPDQSVTGTAVRRLERAERSSVEAYRVTLDTPLDPDWFPLDGTQSATVYANVCTADEGKTLPPAVLGNGDSRQTFQTFRLPKAPLTHRFDPTATPPWRPALTIEVDGREWKWVSDLWGHAGNAHVYVVRHDDEGQSYVQFGDGVTGARLPSGEGNVVAQMRVGLGANGGLRSGTSVQTKTRIPNLHRVDMPTDATRGAQAETAANARRGAPLYAQALGRIATIADYEAELWRIPGVERVAARWGLHRRIPSVLITVLLEQDRHGEYADIREAVLRACHCRGTRRHSIVVRQGHRRPVFIDATICLEPGHTRAGVETELRAALGLRGAATSERHWRDGVFGDGRRFGQSEHESTIVGALQRIPGIAWARITGFGPLTLSDGRVTPPPPRPVRRRLDCSDTTVLTLEHTDGVDPIQLSVAASDRPTDGCSDA